MRKIQYIKLKKKRTNTLRYNNFSLLTVYMRLFTSDLCELPLETGFFDSL